MSPVALWPFLVQEERLEVSCVSYGAAISACEKGLAWLGPRSTFVAASQVFHVLSEARQEGSVNLLESSNKLGFSILGNDTHTHT